jgi:hypothetical protein
MSTLAYGTNCMTLPNGEGVTVEPRIVLVVSCSGFAVVFSTVYPSASNLAVLAEVAASLLLAVSLLGFLAAFRRSRAMVKLFLLLTLAMLIFWIVICVLVSGLG